MVVFVPWPRGKGGLLRVVTSESGRLEYVSAGSHLILIVSFFFF